MHITGNKGEWSELYVLFKILADKCIYAGDSDLEKIESLLLPVIKILRDESNGTYEFSYFDDIVLIKGNKEEFRIPVQDFKKQATHLLKRIQVATDRTFTIPETENFINSFRCNSIKAKSSSKSDIRIVIHDQKTGTNPELGFSIKSQLGGSSTLLNASRSTNFVYKVHGNIISESLIERVNKLDGAKKIQQRVTKILQAGGDLTFSRTENSIFGNNLSLIDTALPNIISHMLLRFFTSPLSKTADLVDDISNSNPLRYDFYDNHPFYIYKMKKFLTDIALGMMPASVWTGTFDATGGYLIVKKDGEILCYHLYNRNQFEDYLLYNTKFETASSSKHNFGFLYEDEGELFFKLNLQIRFLK